MLLLSFQNIRLTKEEWEQPLFQRLLQLAEDAALFDADLVSFEKELDEQKGQLHRVSNLVAATAILDKCSLEDAMNKIGKDCQKLERETLDVMNQLVSDSKTSDEMKLYIKSLAYMLGGNHVAGRVILRYKPSLLLNV